MPHLRNLLDGSPVSVSDMKEATKQLRKYGGTGCTNCGLNETGCKWTELPLRKKNILVLSGAVNDIDLKSNKPLAGPRGLLLKKELASVGVNLRKDCDIQYVVRCVPTDASGRFRAPKDEEIHACSYYTDKAFRTLKPNVILALGSIAKKALIGGKVSPTGLDVAWSDRYNAHVVATDSLAYIVTSKDPRTLKTFKNALRIVSELANCPSRFGYLDRLDYREIPQTVASVRDFLRKLTELDYPVAIDTEFGRKKDDGTRDMLCIGFSYKRGLARVLFIDHPERTIPPDEREGIYKALRTYFRDPNAKKCFHYGTADVPELKEMLGVRVKGEHFDTAYGTYFANPGLRQYGLENQVAVHLPEMAGFKSIVDPYVDMRRVDYALIPWEILLKRNAGDVDATFRLYELTKEWDTPLMRLYIRAGHVLKACEERGVPYDYEYTEELTRAIPRQIRDYEAQMYAYVPVNFGQFKPGNSKHVGKLLFDVLGLPETADRTADDNAKTGVEVLEELKKYHPLPEIILLWRGLTKQLSTYINGYRESADHFGGVVKTIFWLTGAITGRLRSSKGSKNDKRTNLQNIASTPLVKNLLISDRNWRRILELDLDNLTPRELDELLDLEVFISADYSQMELRILAHIAKIKSLIQAFRDDKDIHASVGHLMTGKPYELFVTNDIERRKIKTFNFGIIYGLTPEGAHATLKAQGINIKVSEVKKNYKQFFKANAGLDQYFAQQHKFGRLHKYVETMFGFRRPLDNSGGRTTNSDNQAVNTPIQGSAHQILLCALALLHLFPKRYNRLRKMVLEVHDALVFRVKLRHLAEAFDQCQQLMVVDTAKYIKAEFGIEMSVPLKSDAKCGFRYGVMVDYSTANPDPVEFLRRWKAKNEKVSA